MIDIIAIIEINTFLIIKRISLVINSRIESVVKNKLNINKDKFIKLFKCL